MQFVGRPEHSGEKRTGPRLYGATRHAAPLRMQDANSDNEGRRTNDVRPRVHSSRRVDRISLSSALDSFDVQNRAAFAVRVTRRVAGGGRVIVRREPIRYTDAWDGLFRSVNGGLISVVSRPFRALIAQREVYGVQTASVAHLQTPEHPYYTTSISVIYIITCDPFYLSASIIVTPISSVTYSRYIYKIAA